MSYESAYGTTARYSYARERSPLWSNYWSFSALGSEVHDQNRLAHLATPLFTERRIQQNTDPNSSSRVLDDSPKKYLKCLNCGLKGHTILKCDKISRFSDLSSRETLSDSEDFGFRRARSVRLSRQIASDQTTSVNGEINSDFNLPKLSKCRLCGLKGHLSLNCHRDGSPGAKRLMLHLPSKFSHLESPFFGKKKWEMNSWDSDGDSPVKQNGATSGRFIEGLRTPKTTLHTPLRSPELETIPDSEPVASRSLPVRFKNPNPKRVRIDIALDDPDHKTERRRPTATGAEADNDSGLGFCSSSDADTSPNDIFDILESSIRQFEEEIGEESNKNSTDRVCDDEGSKANTNPTSPKDDSYTDAQSEKKLFKLRLKLIKSWFKKSVQK